MTAGWWIVVVTAVVAAALLAAAVGCRVRRVRAAVWVVAVLVGSLTIRGLKGAVERPAPAGRDPRDGARQAEIHPSEGVPAAPLR